MVPTTIFISRGHGTCHEYIITDFKRLKCTNLHLTKMVIKTFTTKPVNTHRNASMSLYTLDL